MRFIGILGLLMVGQLARAQTDSSRYVNANVIHRTHPQYDEEIMYYGKRNRYFTVRTLQKNGTLFRTDSYKVLPRVMASGFELDSLHRISRYGPMKLMYPNGRVHMSCEYKDDLLQGPFLVFYEDGALERREYYRQGEMRQRACYAPDGSPQAERPYYQLPQFMGDVDSLNHYLEQRVGSLLDGNRIRTITAILSISEIGQVVRIGAVAEADSSAGALQTTAIARMRQAILYMPEWVPNHLNWKPALSGGQGTPSGCALQVYREGRKFKSRMQFQMYP